MSALDRALADYLAMRRALGYDLGRSEKLLGQLIVFLGEHGAEVPTSAFCLKWACLPAAADRSWRAHRLGVARGFCTYLHALDPAVEVPPRDLLPSSGSQRITPYLYSDEEIAALVTAAKALPNPLRKATFAMLVGLLTATGIRIGEAIALDLSDVDLDEGVIVVRGGKQGKSRELALHATVVDALRLYARERERLIPRASEPALLVSLAGTRLRYDAVHLAFKRLVEGAGLRPRSARCRPTIHSLRHTFAVRTLIDAEREGADVGRRLALLSTYLGHVSPSSTYWYLEASPELLGLAADRLEHRTGGTP